MMECSLGGGIGFILGLSLPYFITDNDDYNQFLFGIIGAIVGIFIHFLYFGAFAIGTKNISDPYENNELLFAIENENIFLLENLLNSGHDVNSAIDDNVTPLMIAVRMKKLDIVKTLIKYDADINAKTNLYNITPLYRAIENNDIDMVKLLIDNNAEINVKTSNGKSLLWLANHLELSDIERILLDNGAK